MKNVIRYLKIFNKMYPRTFAFIVLLLMCIIQTPIVVICIRNITNYLYVSFAIIISIIALLVNDIYIKCKTIVVYCKLSAYSDKLLETTNDGIELLTLVGNKVIIKNDKFSNILFVIMLPLSIILETFSAVLQIIDGDGKDEALFTFKDSSSIPKNLKDTELFNVYSDIVKLTDINVDFNDYVRLIKWNNVTNESVSRLVRSR